MKKLYIALLILLHSAIGICQNLISNPSFEYFTSCPNASLGNDLINFSFPWFNPTGNGSYVFIDCQPPPPLGYRVPDNGFGPQYPKTGNAYSEVVTRYMPFGWNGRSYIETPLTVPLIAGQRYWVEFYVSLGDISGFATNNIGAYFSTDSLVDYTNYYYVIPNIIPQFESSGISASFQPGCGSPCGTYPTMLTVYPAGGSPPYSYLWYNGNTTNRITGVYPGIDYPVTITDANGCSVTVAGRID